MNRSASPRRRGIDVASEQAVFEQLHERLGTEHADEEVERVQDSGENRQARDRPARGACECLLDVSQ